VSGDSFVHRYREDLERHVADQAAPGFGDAADLGRGAFVAGMSLLELVEAQGHARRQVAPTTSAALDVCDRFFTATLAGFEVAQRAHVDALQDRVRGELLRRLTSAYVAVTTAKTADERCETAARQIELLLAAPTARVELLTHGPAPVELDLPVLTAALPGGGRIVVLGAPGRVWSDADEAVLQQVAVLIHSPIVEARLLELTERLERIGALLGEETDPQSIIERMLADGLDETGAAFGVILTADAAGRLKVVGARTSGRWAVGDIAGTDDDSPIATAVRTGRPLFLHDGAAIVRWAEERGLAAPPADAGEAWAVVPLPAGGALGLRFEEPQAFDPAQRSFLIQLGERLAAALERGRTFTAERDARRQAELATARISQLQQLAALLSEATTQRGVAATLLDHLTTTTGAAGGFVAVPMEGPDDVAVLWSVGPHGRPSGDRLEAIARLLAAGPPHPDPFEVASLPAPAGDVLRAEEAAMLAVFSVATGARRAGRVAVWWREEVPALVDRDQLVAAVAMAGPALRRASRYDIEHDISLTLQRSLLTVANVEIPGIEWSARYRSGSRGVAGGDWYDVIALEGGRVAVAVGDIVGKGVEAAAAMGQVRSATRALARHLDDPARLLEALDGYAASTGPGQYSSAVFVVIDPSTGDVQHAVAGHPPPVVRSARRGTFTLETGRGPLLGIGGRRAADTVRLDAGDLLVLYTDGLVERRRRSLDDGLRRLRDAVRTGSTQPARLCQEVIAACDDERASDDIAVVVVKVTGP
jgi:serine phosphatase RsbU (regulator of sigma subunit)